MANSQTPRIDRDELLRIAHGQWDIVFQECCPALDEAMNAPRNDLVPCPRCGGDTKFRLFKGWEEKGDGICNSCGAHKQLDMVMWVNSWDFLTALHEAHSALHGYSTQHGALPAPRVRVPDPEDDKRRLDKLKRTFDWSMSLDDPRASIGRRYLENRGVATNQGWPRALRFIQRLPYYQEIRKGEFVEMGKFPALLAVVTNAAGKAITLHRIYLTEDGQKAPFDNVKKSMPSPSDRPQHGIMVRLGQPAKILHLAEGVETALAVTQITGQACWATISAVHLAAFDPPAGVEAVCIWADKDRSGTGERDALALRDRLRQSGIRAVVALPPYDIPDGKKGFDWLDALDMYGLATIRSSVFFARLGNVLNAVEALINVEKKQQR